MLSKENQPASESFEEKLKQLRMRIDLLPESQRPHLVELANAIQQQLPRTQKNERTDHANT